ncbi:MAG: hypothetical protein GXZ08_01305, partial [Tissierellia bacterium]|nr:hypothetical protein [Tissierellia bacterium]
MKIKSQRILSLLLVIAMLISNIIAPVKAFADEAINENEPVTTIEDVEESATTLEDVEVSLTTLEDVEESATTLEDIDEMYSGGKTEVKKIKISKDSKTKVDITEYMQESIRSKSKTRTKRSTFGAETYAADDLKLHLAVNAEYIPLEGSKYKLEDYVNENIRFDINAVYMGDEPVGNIGSGHIVTDKLTPKEVNISRDDIYGNGGEEGKDLLTEDLRIEGYTQMPDYYTTSYTLTVDESCFKKAPSGVDLD